MFKKYDSIVDTGDRYKCIEPNCQNTIYFGSKDRAYYISRGWVDEMGEPIKPKRCKSCRAKRKAKQEREKNLLLQDDSPIR